MMKSFWPQKCVQCDIFVYSERYRKESKKCHFRVVKRLFRPYSRVHCRQNVTEKSLHFSRKPLESQPHFWLEQWSFRTVEKKIIPFMTSRIHAIWQIFDYGKRYWMHYMESHFWFGKRFFSELLTVRRTTIKKKMTYNRHFWCQKGKMHTRIATVSFLKMEVSEIQKWQFLVCL